MADLRIERSCPFCKCAGAYQLTAFLPRELQPRIIVTMRHEPSTQRTDVREICTVCLGRERVVFEQIPFDGDIEGRLIISSRRDTVMRVVEQRGDWLAKCAYFFAGEEQLTRILMRELRDEYLLLPASLGNVLELERKRRQMMQRADGQPLEQK
jgi:hypothetical protein